VAPGALPRRLWLVTLVVGVVLWAAVTVAVALTDDTVLVPNLILLGSFLVPVCTVLFVLGRPREAHLSIEAIILGFLAGGTAGLVLTGTTEVYVLPDHLGTNVLTGLIEESGKALVLVGVAALVTATVRVPRDGMVLGATIGAGYSAFESAGYALGALIQYTDDRPVLNVVQTEAERASLAPFGHIAWTALLGGAIFASAWSTDRFRLDRRVLWTFLGVAALHACWDASYGCAIRISEGLGGEGWKVGWPDTAAWVGTPTGTDLLRFQVVYAVLQGLLSLIGLVWAIRRWRIYRIDRWSEAHPRAVAHQ
jgi:RsiW-degrading membrane proteinase PrsW (M82 family)